MHVKGQNTRDLKTFGGFGHINGLQLFNFGQDMDNPVALLITTVI